MIIQDHRSYSSYVSALYRYVPDAETLRLFAVHRQGLLTSDSQF